MLVLAVPHALRDPRSRKLHSERVFRRRESRVRTGVTSWSALTVGVVVSCMSIELEPAGIPTVEEVREALIVLA